MATSQADVKSQAIELSTEAFEAFCQDISGMFGMDTGSTQQQPCSETIEGLNKRFEKLTAVNSIKSEGVLGGKFQIVFDKQGLFTLAGVIVALPEQEILQNCKNGTTEEAEDIADAVEKAGNMLVESWEKIFSEKLEGHGNFAQTEIFIGNPWESPAEKIGLAEDEEFLFVPYQMTIGSCPAFNCGVIFPKTIFDNTQSREAESLAPADDEKENDSQDESAQQPGETEQETSEENQPEDKEPAEQPESDSKEISETDTETKAEDSDIAASDSEVEVESEQPQTPQTEENTEATAGPVSETIQNMAQSPADLPGTAGMIPLEMCAKDIMQKDVLWGNAEDSVQEALTKMQQADVGYMLVGTEPSFEGIVSTFDMASAISVYLKPMFAKWRRPIDDATLQIKIKWIMTREVQTIKPDTSVAAIMEKMRQSGLRCLPVVDERGKVLGLVTVFDIFKAMLNTNVDISITGKTPQVPLPV